MADRAFRNENMEYHHVSKMTGQRSMDIEKI